MNRGVVNGGRGQTVPWTLKIGKGRKNGKGRKGKERKRESGKEMKEREVKR